MAKKIPLSKEVIALSKQPWFPQVMRALGYEPVVRCKDCKYLNIINKAPVYACCSKHNHTFYLWEEDTRKHFCSWSEKREDADNNLIDTTMDEELK